MLLMKKMVPTKKDFFFGKVKKKSGWGNPLFQIESESNMSISNLNGEYNANTMSYHGFLVLLFGGGISSYHHQPHFQAPQNDGFVINFFDFKTERTLKADLQ